jgi:hypothetical protein
VTPDPELLGDEPVRLGRRRERDDEREMLAAEPGPLWRPPRWMVVSVVLLALVATAGWYVDRQDRAREARALDVCRHELHNAVVFANLRLLTMADYLDPALGATSGVQRAHLADLMSQPAQSVLADVQRVDRDCRGVSVRPWHLSLASQRRATTAYADALASRMRAVAAQGRSYYRHDTGLSRLRRAADIGVIGGPF